MTRPDGARARLYHRLHRLLPAIEFVRVRPALRRAGRLLGWAAVLLYFGFVALVLALRYSILPNIEQYRPGIEQLSSRALGLQVNIGRIDASWLGLSPDLTLSNVQISDAEGRPALAFSRIEAVLSWWSVPKATLKLRLLRIDEPVLHLRRDAEGRLFIAGIPLADSNENDGQVSDWVRAQRRIRINGATVVWEDEKRKAAPLILEDLNFALDNDGRRHRFGLTALPPPELASRIDLRGEFLGRDLQNLESWSGNAFASLEYIDLAALRMWLDYPLALPSGRGAVHGWLNFANGRLREMTADVALHKVDARLASHLPPLALDYMRGRLTTRFTETGFEVRGQHVELSGHEQGQHDRAGAAVIPPTDFSVSWQPVGDGVVSGSAAASRLDFSALRTLAAYLPLDANSRQLLEAHAPEGVVDKLSLSWKGNAERLQAYGLKANFSGLGMRAQGYFPGFSGLVGRLEADQNGGTVSLDCAESSLDLPSVFPESRIGLDSLNARVKWLVEPSGVRVELSRAEFASPDAAGSAQGTYRSQPDGPGVIDLTAALTRGDARAVWRYMPHVVGEGARHWLRDSLVSGRASEARLTLRGDLRDFPFLDKQKGDFLVTVKAHDAVLDYAKGWPRIEGIDGNLRFEGNGMIVEAQRGVMLGATLGATRAEIPDFDQPISNLHIKGKASGPTAEFLRFIDLSPVAERIDYFTADMRAAGRGDLDLSLSIPLDEALLDQSKINGVFHFANNELTVDSALPPIKQVNGRVQFSGSDLQLPEINGVLFGGPLRVRGGTQKDGRVLITANGTLNAANWRKQGAPVWLDRLAGSAAYRGEVRVNGRHADIVIESNLSGLSVDLPAPFSKKAEESWPLRFERRNLVEAGRKKGREGNALQEQTRFSLAGLANGEILRHKTPSGFVVDRAAIAVGQPVTLPEQGVLVALQSERLDLDAWQVALSGVSGGSKDEKLAVPSVDAVSLKVGELIVHGYALHDLKLNAGYKDASRSVRGARWGVAIDSREASGEIAWEVSDAGTLTARLKRLTLDPAALEGGAKRDPAVIPNDSKKKSQLNELPAVDLVAENFSVGQRRLGRLELQARNTAGVWRVDRLKTDNAGSGLTASGEWNKVGARPLTRFDFVFESPDGGRSLEQFGYPGTLRGGSTKLSGSLTWSGSPVDLDFPSLNGDLQVDVGKGQFLKLDPGAAGKLLGLISLQGLPRRITLDFKDVFSEGFAFDSIAGKLTIKQGVMRTERLQIDGPSARVVMRGEVDLQRETQRLTVNVQPELGGTAALGVAVLNPVAGVATWVAHKVLQNPLNHIFGFDYLVTGRWDDPKVEKLSANEPAPSVPRLPTITPSTGSSNEPSTK